MLLGLVAFVARILLDPLAAVANSARRISGGTFDVSLPRESKDEIGDLVRAFREMATAVQRRQREVTEALAREREQSEISAALRVKAEREHQRLQATIETVPVALVIVDAETGRIVLRNRTAGALIGHEPDEAAARVAYWRAFAVTTRDGTLTFWPLRKHFPTVVDGYTSLWRPLAFSPDGRWLATGWGDHRLRLWPLGERASEGHRILELPEK